MALNNEDGYGIRPAAIALAGVLLACVLACIVAFGCAAPKHTPEEVGPSLLRLGRLTCTVVVAEGSGEEILKTQVAVTVAKAAIAGGSLLDSKAALVLFPKRVAPYVRLLLVELGDDPTFAQFAAYFVPFLDGCAEMLPYPEMI